MVDDLAVYGYDTLRPMIAAATFASAGVALGVFFTLSQKRNQRLGAIFFCFQHCLEELQSQSSMDFR